MASSLTLLDGTTVRLGDPIQARVKDVSSYGYKWVWMRCRVQTIADDLASVTVEHLWNSPYPIAIPVSDLKRLES